MFKILLTILASLAMFSTDWEIGKGGTGISDAVLSDWCNNGICYATDGYAAGQATISVVTLDGHAPTFGKVTQHRGALGVSGLQEGDYLLFTVPVGKLRKGTDVDFMLTLDANGPDAPERWACEILDGGEWRGESRPYSFYTKYMKSDEHATYTHTFTLRKAVKGKLQIRVRVAAPVQSSTDYTYLVPFDFHTCSICAYPGIKSKDSHKVGVLGNSFTYFYGSAFMLKKIARSQGHTLDMHISLKGGQYFRQHLKLGQSQAVIRDGGYDWFILQDQSQQHAFYYARGKEDVLPETREMAQEIRRYSPDCSIILENTWPNPQGDWSGFGSLDAYGSALSNGVASLAADPQIEAKVSPVGVAFMNAYKAGITDLYHTDGHHQNRTGSYLKACVHYLFLFGGDFDGNVPDCGVDPVLAAQLRRIARQTVIGD